MCSDYTSICGENKDLLCFFSIYHINYSTIRFCVMQTLSQKNIEVFLNKFCVPMK